MRILIVGETWTTVSTHIKGADTFTTSTYGSGVEPLRNALLSAGHNVDHIPCEAVMNAFPIEREALDAWDTIILSDIGTNSFVLSDRTRQSEVTSDRLQNLADWTRAGGTLVMIGGYLSFTGLEGKARYGKSPLADVLPVTMLEDDDRAERPAGVAVTVLEAEHPLLQNIGSPWPRFLGYNQVRAKHGAEVVALIDEDPLLVAWGVGDGQSVVFTTECAPHWATPEFLGSPQYGALWDNIALWKAAA